MKQRKIRNLIGPQVRRLRCHKKWSQEKLMLQLQDLGWNICRQRIARIECCEAWVSDFEILLVATALEVELTELLPKLESNQPLYLALSKLLAGQVKALASPEDILADRSLRALRIEMKKPL
jgi:transcriptional regulator with XRE-family HTH domain